MPGQRIKCLSQSVEENAGPEQGEEDGTLQGESNLFKCFSKYSIQNSLKAQHLYGYLDCHLKVYLKHLYFLCLINLF